MKTKGEIGIDETNGNNKANYNTCIAKTGVYVYVA